MNKIITSFLLILILIPESIHALTPEKQFGRYDLKSGAISFFGIDTTLNISINTTPAPQCSVEQVENPVRVVIKCKGEIIKNTTPLTLSGSEIATRIRFGTSDGFSRIVVDIKGEAPSVTDSKSSDGTLLFTLSHKSTAKAAATPIVITGEAATPVKVATTVSSAVLQPSPQANTPTVLPAHPTATAKVSATLTTAPTATVITAAAHGTKTAVPKTTVFTPAPPPQLLHGETELYSLLFGRDDLTKAAVLKIKLKEQAKTELKKDTSHQYTLKILGARISSPIFAQLQTAPDGSEPFSNVLVTESVVPGKAVDLLVKITMKNESNLTLKQSGSDIEISAGR